MTGRNLTYSNEIADAICERIANGESLRQICQDPDMPGRTTVLRWMEQFPAFGAKCARAREWQGEHVFDQIAALEERLLAEAVDPNVARVAIGSMQWRAGRLAPKRFGDKQYVDTTSTVTVQTTRKLDISTLTDEQLDALEGALRATVAQLSGPAGTVIDHED